MSLPLTLILKELKTLDNSVLPILSSLHNDKSIIKNASTTEKNHLISRTLNLSRSKDTRKRWASLNILYVLCEEYEMIYSEGTNIIVQLLKVLGEESQSGHILTSVVETLNKITEQIRGKPTLTREILTPKLPTIISLYVEKVHLQPQFLTDSLTDIMKRHPTVFRPYANKLELKLIQIIQKKNFNNFPENVKDSIYRCLATLPVIEKGSPELKWENNLQDCIKEVAGVLRIYKIFLNFNDEEDLNEQFQKLPQSGEGESRRLLPDLDISLDDNKSILGISESIAILLDVIKSQVTTSTSFGVKVPLGMIVLLNEVICSINTRFVKFNLDIRDDQVKETVKISIARNQKNSVRFLTRLAEIYRGNALSHFTKITSFLESLVPLQRKKIDYENVIRNEGFYRDMLLCISSYLSLVTYLEDASPLIRIVDLALLLIEPRSTETISSPKNNGAHAANKSKKKRNKKESMPMSDMLSHGKLFETSVPQEIVKTVRHFFSIVIPRLVLPPTQHYKLMKYLIVESVKMKSFDLYGQVPPELRDLMTSTVLHGGFEKVSLLPIVSNVLTNDPVISVFNNPRFPPLPAKVQRSEIESSNDVNMQSEAESDQESVEQEVERRDLIHEIDNEQNTMDLENFKRRKIDESDYSQGKKEQTQNLSNEVIESQNQIHFTPERTESSIGTENSQTLLSSAPEIQTTDILHPRPSLEEQKPTAPQFEVKQHESQTAPEDYESSESEFEVPVLNMEEDSDQE